MNQTTQPCQPSEYDNDATDGVAYGYLAELYATAGRDQEATWARREAERWEQD